MVPNIIHHCKGDSYLKKGKSSRAYILLQRRGHATSTTIEIFSVLLFLRTRSIGSIVQTGTLKIFDVVWSSMPSSPKEYISP